MSARVHSPVEPPRHRSLWRWFAAPFWAAGFCVLGPLAAFLVSCWLGGYRLQPVLTGSMAPTYPAGSLVVVAPVDPGDVVIGTPIAFEVGGGALVTHRVVEVVHDEIDGLEFRTQGDHNASPDEDLVPARRVRGEVRWNVTKVGALLVWLRWPRGFLVTTVPALVLFVLGELTRLARRMWARGRDLATPAPLIAIPEPSVLIAGYLAGGYGT